MKDPQLDALTSQMKKLTGRVGALEKLLERMLRQKPVSEKQLHQTLKNSGVNPPEPGP